MHRLKDLNLTFHALHKSLQTEVTTTSYEEVLFKRQSDSLSNERHLPLLSDPTALYYGAALHNPPPPLRDAHRRELVHVRAHAALHAAGHWEGGQSAKQGIQRCRITKQSDHLAMAVIKNMRLDKSRP